MSNARAPWGKERICVSQRASALTASFCSERGEGITERRRWDFRMFSTVSKSTKYDGTQNRKHDVCCVCKVPRCLWEVEKLLWAPHSRRSICVDRGAKSQGMCLLPWLVCCQSDLQSSCPGACLIYTADSRKYWRLKWSCPCSSSDDLKVCKLFWAVMVSRGDSQSKHTEFGWVMWSSIWNWESLFCYGFSKHKMLVNTDLCKGHCQLNC